MGKQNKTGGGCKGSTIRKAGVVHKTSSSSRKGSCKVDPLMAMAKGARECSRTMSAVNAVRPVAVQAGLLGKPVDTADCPAWAVKVLGENLIPILEAGYAAGLKAEAGRKHLASL